MYVCNNGMGVWKVWYSAFPLKNQDSGFQRSDGYNGS
jgi:hypothetical protein